MKPRCVDCLPTSRRKAPHPGPRCATHHRAVKALRRNRTHAQRLLETYNLPEERYWALYRAQGGRCAICQRATGARRRLSVDHDHRCCSGPFSCGKCVRGLLCRKCNADVLGHLRDNVESLHRAIEYLENPPAKRVLK